MMKKKLLKMPIIGCVFFLLLVAACGSNSKTSITGTPTDMQTVQTETTTTLTPTSNVSTEITATPTTTSTVNQADFAATVGSSGNPINRDAQGDNLTTIHSAVDRPVAKITQTILNVPPRAKGVVYIQNDSANAQTLVSDTADGFAPFTVAPYTSTSLVFHRTGTFKAHLKDYPISADTVITIIITIPSPD